MKHAILVLDQIFPEVHHRHGLQQSVSGITKKHFQLTSKKFVRHTSQLYQESSYSGIITNQKFIAITMVILTIHNITLRH